MAKGQELIEEIVRRRSGFPGSVRYTGAPFELDMLKHSLGKAGEGARALAQLVPVRVVACLEGCLKAAAAELIDHGDPYLQRARDLSAHLKLDFDILAALLGKRITVGEMVVHSLKWQNLASVHGTMTTLLGVDFFKGLSGAKDRWNTNADDKPTIIVKDINVVLSTLAETIRIRQILCHEVAPFFTLSPEDALGMLDCGWQFTHATSWLISETLYPNAPLTQSEMTAAAWRDAEGADADLQALVKEFSGKLDEEDQALLSQSQDAWLAYREKFAQLEGNAAKGGTLSPQLRGMAHARASRARIDELRASVLFTGWESSEA